MVFSGSRINLLKIYWGFKEVNATGACNERMEPLISDQANRFPELLGTNLKMVASVCGEDKHISTTTATIFFVNIVYGHIFIYYLSLDFGVYFLFSLL